MLFDRKTLVESVVNWHLGACTTDLAAFLRLGSRDVPRVARLCLQVAVEEGIFELTVV